MRCDGYLWIPCCYGISSGGRGDRHTQVRQETGVIAFNLWDYLVPSEYHLRSKFHVGGISIRWHLGEHLLRNMNPYLSQNLYIYVYMCHNFWRRNRATLTLLWGYMLVDQSSLNLWGIPGQQCLPGVSFFSHLYLGVASTPVWVSVSALSGRFTGFVLSRTPRYSSVNQSAEGSMCLDIYHQWHH